MNYLADEKGFYGQFGGSFIPEMLRYNIDEINSKYKKIVEKKSFQRKLKNSLRDYVGRPTPLFFCKKLSSIYCSNIYLKREDLNHTGSHKINNALGQALLAKTLGKRKIIAETGAGQHGVAVATVCAFLGGLECIIFMGKKDIERQSPNVSRMNMLGAKVIQVFSGQKTLKDAVNESIRFWINHPESYYLIGSSVGPHPYPKMVTEFQSIISEEIREQLLKKEGVTCPNYILACIGGGSNASGAFYHFLNRESVKLIAVEAVGSANESSTVTCIGTKGVLHGSMTIIMQNEDGQIVNPCSISAGLNYPGIGPMHAHLFESKRVKFISATDEEAIQAAYEISKLEGILPALESAHALAILPKLHFKREDLVIVNLSGRGDKDMKAYIHHFT